ncbi:MAG: lecithin retinol acyltransferase family protein [Magnetospirillum gryphiswaldense]|nr:lecithin retinol acyltransferase family protein [Magnetospirillum gryphiswaldense]
MFLPATILETPLPFGYRHYGVLTEIGTVVHASKKHNRVIEESLENFSEGAPCRMASFQSNLSPNETIQRARSKIGNSYDLISKNCEHLVRYCCGHGSFSVQIITTIIVAITYFIKAK